MPFRLPVRFAAPAPRGRRMRGVTLLEMLLVIALIGGAGVLTVALLGGGIDGLRLRTAGKQLAGELRQLRTRAIASGTPQQFEIDPRSHAWSSTLGHHGQIPPQLEIRFTGARELRPAPGRGAIRFFADGASSGGRIELQARQAGWRVEVAWITGEVRSGRIERSP